MSQDPRTFNKEDKVTWDELADSLQQLITQIKTDLANEIIDRKAVCEKLQKEIDALFDKDGHLVFPNGNTIWIDANNGTLPSTGTGSGVTEVSEVTFDQLDSNMQDRLNDDKVGIAQALSENEELKKSIQTAMDELEDSLQKLITQNKTDLANEIKDRKTTCEKLQKEIDAVFDKDGHLVFPNGNTLWIDANNGTLPSTGTGTGTGTGSTSEVSNVAFDQLDDNLQQRFDDDKAGITQALSEIDELKKLIQANTDDDKASIAQALSEIDELKKLIQANTDEITKLKAQMEASGAAAAAGGGGNGMNLDFTRATTLSYVVTQIQTDGVHNLRYYIIPENGYVFIKVSSYMVDDNIAHSKATYSSSFSIGKLSVDTGDYYLDKYEHRCFPVSKDDVIHTSGEAYVVFIPLKK